MGSNLVFLRTKGFSTTLNSWFSTHGNAKLKMNFYQMRSSGNTTGRQNNHHENFQRMDKLTSEVLHQRKNTFHQRKDSVPDISV